MSLLFAPFSVLGGSVALLVARFVLGYELKTLPIDRTAFFVSYYSRDIVS